MNLTSRVALVTGAGQGIGQAIALELARTGAYVVVNDIVHERAAETVDKISESGGTAIANSSDISVEDGVEEFFNAARQKWGKVDILVNNAGILRDKMSFNMTLQDWDDVIRVCLTGPFLCSRAFARQGRQEKRGGVIINVTSRSGLRGNVGQANYSAAKAGIAGLTRTMSLELKKYGIRVNAICPRAVTGMTNSVPKEVQEKKDANWKGSGVRKRGEPADVAPIVAFLAGDECNDVTGQIVGLGGDKLSLWAHPVEKCEAFIFGGWSCESLESLFFTSVGAELESVGNKD